MRGMKRLPTPRPAGAPRAAVNSAESIVPGADRPASVGPLLGGAAGLVFLGIAALAVDVPVAAWCKDGAWPAAMPSVLVKIAGEIHRLVTLSELIGHTVSVVILLGLVAALDGTLAWPLWRAPAFGRPARQPTPQQATFARFLGATFTGGILTDIIKLLVDRVRPRAADFVAHGSVWDSFNEEVIATVTGSRSNINSFPSGHSAIAAGFAAALAWKYPRGQIFFAIFALMAASQRIVSSAHFPSDACCGAALGIVGASFFLRRQPWQPALLPPSKRGSSTEAFNGSPAGDAV